MFDIPALERTYLSEPDVRVVICVEIGVTSPLRYCTGSEPVQHDSDWYYPGRVTKVGNVMISSPTSSATSIMFHNTDSVLSAANASERFSDNQVAYHILMKRHGEADWTQIGDSIEWKCSSCKWNATTFTVLMNASIGDAPRAGSEIASVRCGLIPGDSRCKLSPVAHCSGTWDACKAHSNTANFRGFRFAPDEHYVIKGIYGYMRFQSSGASNREETPGGGAGPIEESGLHVLAPGVASVNADLLNEVIDMANSA